MTSTRLVLLSFFVAFGCSEGSGGLDAGFARDAPIGRDATPSLDAAPRFEDAGTDIDGGTGEPRTYSTDPLTFGGDPRCISGGFFLCDSFEFTLDPLVWSMPDNRNGNAIAIDDTRAMRGTRALHITTLGNSPETFIYNESIFPAAAEEHWGRAFFYIESPLPIASGTIHWTLAELVTRHDDDARNILARVAGGVTAADDDERFFHNFLFNYEERPRSPGFNESGLGLDERIQPDVWHCVEWYVSVDGVEARFFWNGTEREDLHLMGFTGDDRDIPVDFNPFRRLNIGWTIYQTGLDRAWSVWIDEVAVDDDRIGCNN